MTDTTQDLARELIALAEKLPNGKWTDATGPALHGSYHIVEFPDGEQVCECYDGSDEAQASYTAFIATARNNAPTIARAYLASLEEVERLREDAERYRFVRNQDIENDFPRSGVFVGAIPENTALTGEDADRVIDEARALHPQQSAASQHGTRKE